MNSAETASELIDISMKKAIESHTNARDKLVKENEIFVKEKELWTVNYIRDITSSLGKIIEKNHTDSRKWYYDVFHDKNELMRRIDNYTKYVNNMEKYPDIYVSVAEQIHEFNNHISVLERALKYIDIEQIKSRLDELGYKLEESEEIVNIFWCIPSYKKVRYRLSCKELRGSVSGVMLKKLTK